MEQYRTCSWTIQPCQNKQTKINKFREEQLEICWKAHRERMVEREEGGEWKRGGDNDRELSFKHFGFFHFKWPATNRSPSISRCAPKSDLFPSTFNNRKTQRSTKIQWYFTYSTLLKTCPPFSLLLCSFFFLFSVALFTIFLWAVASTLLLRASLWVWQLYFYCFCCQIV